MFKNQWELVQFLEENDQLLRIKEEVDPSLEMASIHLKVFEQKGPAILFEKVKGTKYPCISNIFGTLERSKLIFEKTLPHVQQMVQLKNDPVKAIKKPWKYLSTFYQASKALPKKQSFNQGNFEEINISDLPQIKHWPMDGGAFITLPQVYTEDIDKPGVMSSNLGMYRIQLSGNDYIKDEEVGLHYQLHRGIGVHQTKANKKGEPLKVSIFVGGHPAHSFAAVMPLPEGISELTFAGALAGRRFRYAVKEGFTISLDADFVITGEVYPGEVKPEGPFGDHFGYYSLTHPFPVMRVHKVYAKKNAIWPFTVVGRPPQEDTQFGALVHEVAGSALKHEIPGLEEVNAVDAAGVHPLLLAIGNERYTPYQKLRQPQELLTIANHILGKGQLSLAKFVWIAAKQDNTNLSTHNIEDFFVHMLERVSWSRDLHFQTNTTIDTLDYSGTDINSGSKVVIAAVGDIVRKLLATWHTQFDFKDDWFTNPTVVLPGIVAISGPTFTFYKEEAVRIQQFAHKLKEKGDAFYNAYPLIVIADDSTFTASHFNNFLWETFTRCNPAYDIYGVDSFIQHKHWGCNGSLIIDARMKPHNAPVLELDLTMEEKAKERFDKLLLN